MSDNGSGLKNGWEKSNGGIENMRARATLISAVLKLEDCRADGGTRFIVRIPISEMDHEYYSSKDGRTPAATTSSQERIE